MTKYRLFFTILTVIFVLTFGYLASLYARGYRFNQKTLKITPSGILVAKSDPDSAQVIIDNTLAGATNTNLTLPPGSYQLEIKKEGYLTWSKKIVIEKEVVTEISAELFRSTPSLTPITFSGVIAPIISADLGKIVYAVPFDKNETTDKSGLWAMETISLPFGFARDPRRITNGDMSFNTWQFSPDSRQLLLTTRTGIYLLDNGAYTPASQIVNIASRHATLLTDWTKQSKTKLQAQIRNLPDSLVDLLTTKASAVSFSPDSSKVLYTASSSATLKENLIKQLPGSSTQKQERSIKVGHTYVYNIKEDRNFLIDDNITPPEINQSNLSNNLRCKLIWFPTSRNLVQAEEKNIQIMDYDGQNRREVYSGSFISPYVFSFGTNGKLIILTNLGADSSPANLYYLVLK